MRSDRTRRPVDARAILIAGVIAGAGVLPLASPAPARASARATCANQLLIGGSYDDVTVTPGDWCAIGYATVRGSINVTGATTFFLFASRVAGNVTISGTASYPNAAVAPGAGTASSICSSAIYGNLTITDSSKKAPWNIGSTNYPPYVNISNCLSQVFVRGNVRFDDNAAGMNEIGGADIEGSLECRSNGGFTTGVATAYQKNGVNGSSSGQCAGFAVKGDNPDIVPGPPPWLVVDPDTPQATPAPAATLARLTRLSETNRRFVPAKASTPPLGSTTRTARPHPHGTTFSFKLDQDATVLVRVEPRACLAVRARHRRRQCAALMVVTRDGHSGVNKLRFTGRVRGHALKPGRYAAVFTAADAAGTSPPRTIAFTVLRH